MEQEVKLKIEGMSCSHCQNFVDGVISDVEGVTDRQVSLDEAQAIVKFDDTKTSQQTIIEAINKTGTYKVIS